MWDLFDQESEHMSLHTEAMDVSKKIRDTFVQNVEYVKMLASPFKGVDMKLNKDIYGIHNICKFFLSLDIKTANFTMLRKVCPSLFTTSQGELITWYQFVKQFTTSNFIYHSKYFRELVFGMTGFISKSTTLQEILMDMVHKNVLKWSMATGISLNLKMKCGDEIVYELSDHENVIRSIDLLKDLIGQDVCQDLHIQIFRVDQIEPKLFFMKTFVYNSDWNIDVNQGAHSHKSQIEFKKVPKFFMPQVIKWYQKLPIQYEDLIFMHEGIDAQYKATIFE